MLLGEIAELKAGVLTNRVLYDARKEEIQENGDEGEDGDYYISVLVPKAIHDGKVDHALIERQKLKTVGNGPKDVSAFRTHEGDIIIKLASPYDACLITKEDEGLLIPSFCLRVAFDSSKVDTFFLLAYFSSGFFMDELKRKCYRSVTALLKKTDFEKITIPDIPLSEQKDIGKRYRSVEKMKGLMKEFIALEKERLDTILEERQC